MPIQEEVERPDRRGRAVQVVLMLLAGGVILLFASGDPIGRLRTSLSRAKTAAATVAPSPPPPLSCSAQQLELGLFFTGCADSIAAASEPCGAARAGVFDGLAHLRDPHHAYLLYLEVDGGYNGPGTYSLAVWPHPTLGVGDGVAKVALREAASGALWRSTAGWLEVDAGGRSGSVRAGLVYDGAEATVLGLKTIGAWSCG